MIHIFFIEAKDCFLMQGRWKNLHKCSQNQSETSRQKTSSATVPTHRHLIDDLIRQRGMQLHYLVIFCLLMFN